MGHGLLRGNQSLQQQEIRMIIKMIHRQLLLPKPPNKLLLLQPIPLPPFIIPAKSLRGVFAVHYILCHRQKMVKKVEKVGPRILQKILI